MDFAEDPIPTIDKPFKTQDQNFNIFKTDEFTQRTFL
jgi:hypothetical protein